MENSFIVKPFKSPCGAEVIGFDCKRNITKNEYNILNQALLDCCFLVFRDQRLDPKNLVNFSQNWGDLQKHILKQYLLQGFPEVLVVSNKKDHLGKGLGIEDAGRYWHSDVSYRKNPPMGSLLYCIDTPPIGGDTLFANQYLAFDLIDKNIINYLKILKGAHSFNYDKLQKRKSSKRIPLTEKQKRELSVIEHPLIRVHPETRRELLYVNPGFTNHIIGHHSDKGLILLNYLFSCATHPSVIHRHKWEKNDLVFWDNRCLMHRATPFNNIYIRHMYRTTISSNEGI